MKELYQRFFNAQTPLFFRRIIYLAITILAAPELLIIVTGLLDQPQYLPDFFNEEWFKGLRIACIGAGLVAKMTVHWGKTDLNKIPDVTPPTPIYETTETTPDQQLPR